MPAAKGSSSGRLSGSRGASIPPHRTSGRPSKAQNQQSAAARTYVTTNPARVDAAKKAAATRKANAALAEKAAAKSNRAQGRRQGFKAGAGMGAAAGAASSFVAAKGSEGPKKSVPVAKKTSPKKKGR
jgi:hypothetical protein